MNKNTHTNIFNPSNIKFNNVPYQNLSNNNQLHIDSWNTIINSLSRQLNNISEYLIRLNKFLFSDTDLEFVSETVIGYLKFLDQRLTKLENKN